MAKEEKLDEMLEKSDDAVSITKNSDDALEFKFKNGLVFENMALPKVEETEEPAPAPETEELCESDESEDGEFSIPDTFVIDEKYNTPPTPDTPSTVVRTYVPRFTGIGDTYRMKDDPRPRPKTEPKPEETKVEVSDEEKIDPTAELEITPDEAVTVKMGGNDNKNPKTLSVFKFAESVSAAMGRKTEKTVEDERAEINELLTPKAKPEPEPAPQPIPEPTPEPEAEPAPAPKAEPKTYSIPDPTDDLHVIDYGKSTREAPKHKIVEPEGASDEAPKSKKRKLGASEFDSQAQRDEFKDAFLDSTLSIKIRLVSMAVIAVLMGLFENIIITPTENNLGSLGIYPGLYGMIDCIFAAAMFIIALPEIARAIKYLTFGRVIPEISLIVAFLVEIAYTVIITVFEAESSPLYGMLFGIFAIVTVASAHYRVNADFTAFKVVSRNIEKQVLDRKLTRTLHDENMALDGAVDEYKSRTARIFHAAFISDFFKRTSKVSENSFASILPMIISFGVALITSVVAFFLCGGIIPAASGFALVFLLSLPSFSILVHKLPYYDAQNAALEENSTLVGETSYRAFSGVDVVAFDDTDIFGIEDISLRRIILYGNNKMEKAMKQMSSLFAPVGGPLYFIFKKTHQLTFRPASDVSIESDGISGMVEGNRISAGTEEYMLRHNIAIPELTNKRDISVDTTRIMYAAENGEVYAKFYVRYSFSEQFTMLLPAIKEEGIVPLIYTRDPNVSNELLRALCAGSDSMRVMKKYEPISPEDNKIYRRISAELITYGNNINIINTVLLTKKYAKFAEQLSGTELYATVFTAAVSAILAIAGVTTIPVIVFSLWQIAWCIVLRLASKRAFPVAEIEEDNS